MVLRDWRAVLQEMPADTPVIFCVTAENAPHFGDYCVGRRVFPSRMWEGKEGWKPCVLVELGEAF
ncbi:MAG: hypothetical protein IJO76_08020 [Clostridia bacterium]|nr:hypothetical protein [Clostridia bacterium]